MTSSHGYAPEPWSSGHFANHKVCKEAVDFQTFIEDARSRQRKEIHW